MRGTWGTKTATVVTDNTVQYHATIVARRTPVGVILDSDGYHTNTTKTRINDALEFWGAQARVFQDDFAWFVRLGDGAIVEFADGMIVK